jgi:hypothetical protein
VIAGNGWGNKSGIRGCGANGEEDAGEKKNGSKRPLRQGSAARDNDINCSILERERVLIKNSQPHNISVPTAEISTQENHCVHSRRKVRPKTSPF